MVTIPKHVLDLLLKGTQLVSKVVIHAKTVSKQAYSHKERRNAKTCGRMELRQLTSPVNPMPGQFFKYFLEIDEKPTSD